MTLTITLDFKKGEIIMLTDFGNINAMNKPQIQTAIDYYNDKIAKMLKDETISAKTREWFLNHYNARVKSLNGTMQKLQNAINQAKLSGVLVNEQTASLDSFGLSASSAGNFSHLSQDQHKQKVKQRLKVLGACLLPVVGTIPFLVSLRRSKRRYKAVQSRLNQENIELDNFITSTKRPYEATLLSAEMFTDEQKQSLLQDPAEISRMETLLASGTISPIEKANLTKKLSNLREFAQQNGYNASVILTDPAFKTEADKTSKFQADYSAVASSGANLKEIYDAIKTLETLKTETKALSDRNPKNTALKTLIGDIDSKIAGLKAGATTLTKDGIAEIVNNISSVAVSSATPATPTVDEYNNAIAGVETASTSLSAKFGTGVSIENAKQMAEELGIVDPDKSPFDEIDKTKQKKLSGFTASRDALQNTEDLKTNIANNLTKLQNALDELKKIKTITKYNLDDAKDYLAEAKSAYTYLLSVKGNLDSAQKAEFTTKKTEYLKQEEKIKKAKAKLNTPAAPAPGSPTP